MRKFVILLLAVALAAVFSTPALALDKGNKRKGKYLYRKVYKECHAAGKIDSPRPPVNPDSKTQAQWTRVFEKKDFSFFGCPDQWAKLTEQQLSDIYAYLYSGAADSPTPAKCK